MKEEVDAASSKAGEENTEYMRKAIQMRLDADAGRAPAGSVKESAQYEPDKFHDRLMDALDADDVRSKIKAITNEQS